MTEVSAKVVVIALSVITFCGMLAWFRWAVVYVNRSLTPLQYRLSCHGVECLHDNESRFDGNWTRLFPTDGVLENNSNRIIQQFETMAKYGDRKLTTERKMKAGDVFPVMRCCARQVI